MTIEIYDNFIRLLGLAQELHRKRCVSIYKYILIINSCSQSRDESHSMKYRFRHQYTVMDRNLTELVTPDGNHGAKNLWQLAILELLSLLLSCSNLGVSDGVKTRVLWRKRAWHVWSTLPSVNVESSPLPDSREGSGVFSFQNLCVDIVER